MKFKTFLNLINPQPEIGGFEINDFGIKFIELRGKKTSLASIQLPPGIIEEGKIKDKDKFFEIISEFRNKITKSKRKKIHIVASISDTNIYTESFVLPRSVGSKLNEAADLNLRMISPIDFDASYHDWQLVGERLVNGTSQLEIFGAFIPKQAVDDFEEILLKAGFEVVAFEFPTYALTRTIMEIGEGFAKEKNYLLVKIGSDNLSFGLIKNGNLNFLHFVSWKSVYGEEKKIPLQSFENLIVDEVKKVLKFQETHSTTAIDGLILFSPNLIKELSKIISDNFPNLPLMMPNINKFKDLAPAWFGVLGSALRGAFFADTSSKMINLAGSETTKRFDTYQILSFIKIWRSLIVIFFGLVLIFYAGLDVFLYKYASQLADQNQNVKNPEVQMLGQLQKAAEDFNQKVDNYYQIRQNELNWSSFFQNVESLAGADITIKRIYVQSKNSPVLLLGEASNNDAIIAFKKALESDNHFSNINFELSSIVPDGKNYDFSISFSIIKI